MAGAIVTALTGLTAASGAAFYLASAVASFAISYVIGAITGPGEAENQGIDEQGVKQRVATDPRNKLPIAYGEKLIAGQIIMADVSSDNQEMAFIIALSEGPVNDINGVKWEDKTLTFNNTNLTTGLRNVTNSVDGDGNSDDFLNDSRFQVRAFPNGGRCAEMEAFSSKWAVDADRRTMPNVAYVYAQIKYDGDKRLTGLATRLQFNVQGKLVRTLGSSGTLSTSTSYSTNPAECLLDYMISSSYGPGVPEASVDLASFLAHKNFCNESVTHMNVTGTTISDNRYTTNGVINSNTELDRNVSNLTIGNSGALTWSYGQFGVISDKVKTSVASFSEESIFGGITISDLGFDNKLNQFTSRYDEKQTDEQEEQVILNIPTSAQNPNEPFLERTINLPMTNNNIEAERVSAIYLNKSRQDLVVEFNTSIAASGVEAGDVISVSHDTPGWTNKLFLVDSVKEGVVNNIVGLTIVAQEYAAAVYDSGVIQEVDPAPNTNFPNPYVSPSISNLLVTEDYTIQPANLVMTWDDPEETYTDHYTIEYRVAGVASSPFIGKTVSGLTRYDINPLAFNTVYEVKVTPVSTLGNRGNTLTDSVSTGISRATGLTDITRYAKFATNAAASAPTTSNGLVAGTWYSSPVLVDDPGFTHTSSAGGFFATAGFATRVTSTFSGNGGGTINTAQPEIVRRIISSTGRSSVIRESIGATFALSYTGDTGSPNPSSVFIRLFTGNGVERVEGSFTFTSSLTTKAAISADFVTRFNNVSAFNGTYAASVNVSDEIVLSHIGSGVPGSPTLTLTDNDGALFRSNIVSTGTFSQLFASEVTISDNDHSVTIQVGSNLVSTSVIDDIALKYNGRGFPYTASVDSVTNTLLFTSNENEDRPALTITWTNGTTGNLNDTGIITSGTLQQGVAEGDLVSGTTKSVLTITKSDGERNGSVTVDLEPGAISSSKILEIAEKAREIYLNTIVSGNSVTFTSIEEQQVTLAISIAAGTSPVGTAAVSNNTDVAGQDPVISLYGTTFGAPINNGTPVT